MMTSHKDSPFDYLMSWSVMNDRMSSKLLTATMAGKIAFRVILHYHVRKTFNKRSSTFLSVTIELACAFIAMHSNSECS